jgi:DNA-binding winged helix-turn-helix (wHTH) protein/predicted Zn-dependent protease
MPAKWHVMEQILGKVCLIILKRNSFAADLRRAMDAAHRYAFGPFVVDRAARRLTYRGNIVPLKGKAFDLLIIFVESRGAALSRDELFERLWPAGSVEDGNLSQNVYLIRRALERAGGTYIETLARFGYRFCAPVTPVAERPGVTPRSVPWRAAIALLVLLVAIGSIAAKPQAPALTGSAREAYLLAQYHLHLRALPELESARVYFTQVIRLAPSEAAGYAGLAAVYALEAEYDRDGSAQQRRAIDTAKRYRDIALARSPNNSDALAAAGFIAYRFDNDPSGAQMLLRNALAADPNNAAAHHWYGVLQFTQEHTPAAIAEFETAHRLEPTSEVFTRWLARAYVYANRPQDALAMVDEVLRIEPDNGIGELIRATAQEQLGDLRGALQTLHDLAERDPWERQFTQPDEARIEARLGTFKRATLVRHVEEALARGTADPFEASLFFYTVGLRDRADAVIRTIKPSYITAAIDRDDPRYKRLQPPGIAGAAAPLL